MPSIDVSDEETAEIMRRRAARAYADRYLPLPTSPASAAARDAVLATKSESDLRDLHTIWMLGRILRL